MKKYLLLLSCFGLVLWSGCKDNDTAPETPASYDATPYTMNFYDLPVVDFPADNKPTVQGVKLGRMLFYEKMLSKDASQACASCHAQGNAFSDTSRFSIGVEKLPGKRQAMAIFNMLYHKKGFFWDGRAPLLRDQALKPIQDPLEMNETLPNMIAKLAASKNYRDQFIRAFGSDTISSERVALALEQFMFSIVSGNAKYDQVKRGTAQFTAEEERGYNLFFTEFDPSGKKKGAECFHCHAGANFGSGDYANNALDSDADIKDEGRAKVTEKAADKAKFKVPSLRNIAVTAPYMHDGRFKSLEEVIEHYNSGAKKSSTVDFLMQYNLQPGGLQLSTQDKQDLLAFLKTLSDPSYLNNEAYKAP